MTDIVPGFPAGLVGEVLVVTSPAEITFGNAGQLRDALDSAFTGRTVVIVDMTATEFCDSSGVAELVVASKRAEKRGDKLRLAMASAAVPRFFKLTGADRVLEIYDSVPEALAGDIPSAGGWRSGLDGDLYGARPPGAGVTVGADTQVTDLTVNDHACLTFGDTEELLDLTAAFVRDGLSAGLKVLWLNDVPPRQALPELGQRGVDIRTAVASGQLVTAPCEGSVLSGQGFAPGTALGWLHRQIAGCRHAGFAGLRVAVDMSWALRPVTGVQRLPEFEEQAAAALTGSGVSLLCQYDRERFDPVTLAQVTAFHDHSVAAATYHADAVLRVCRQYSPPGVRLAGEIDFRAEEPLAAALTEAIRIDGDITVNMTALTFVDAACVRMLINTARSLPPPRRMLVRCPPAAARMFSLMGGEEVLDMTVGTADGG